MDQDRYQLDLRRRPGGCIGAAEVHKDIYHAWKEWNREQGRAWNYRGQRYVERYANGSSDHDHREREFSGIKYFIGGCEVPKWLYNAWEECSEGLPYKQWLSPSRREVGSPEEGKWRREYESWRPRQDMNRPTRRARSESRMRPRSPMRSRSRRSRTQSPRRVHDETPSLTSTRSSFSRSNSYPKMPSPPSLNNSAPAHYLNPAMMQLAQTFKALYPEYLALHKEVTKMMEKGHPAAQKGQDLWRVHEYLEDIKRRICEGAEPQVRDQFNTLAELLEQFAEITDC